MSYGLMCECPLPPMEGLRAADRGHTPGPSSPGGQPGCPNYAEDQERGGLCPFCADAHRIAQAIRKADALATKEPQP